jgi:hypothetical protein
LSNCATVLKKSEAFHNNTTDCIINKYVSARGWKIYFYCFILIYYIDIFLKKLLLSHKND